jgi:3-isopropylmalate/(R)-2-methylmalate dehydratase small subunit
MQFRGRVWVFGDDINTDLILPTPVMTLPPAERPKHMFEANRPGWARQVRSGDIVVAGRNYGTGSGRPGAQVMKDIGLACLLAESINGLFFRNCANYAFPALEVAGVAAAFVEGDVAEVDFAAGTVRNVRTGQELQGVVWPPMLMNVLRAGGIIPLLEAEHLLLPQAR